jgi:glycosyltransferase involved in cell wall biosynthesis
VVNAHGSRDALLVLPSMLSGARLIRSRHISSSIRSALAYRFFRHIIVTANLIKEMLREKGLAPERVSVIGTGVPPRFFSPPDPSSLLEEFPGAKGRKVILNVGMLRSDKGQRYLVESARQLKRSRDDFVLFIVGEETSGSTTGTALRRQIEQASLADHVILTGYRENVAPFLALADAVVVASTGVEGRPQIVGQAFAAGTALVATKVGGIPDLVVDGKTGILVPPRDSAALASALRRLLDDDSLRLSLQREARSFAERSLGFDAMMEQVLEIYGGEAAERPFSPA